MSDQPGEKFVRDGICYYPVDAFVAAGTICRDWTGLRDKLLRVTDDFRPDIIYCFGSEWPFGAIAENTEVPVVIQMMGFLNIYYPLIDMVNGYSANRVCEDTHSPSPEPLRPGIRRRLAELVLGRREPVAPPEPPEPAERPEEILSAFERRVMQANRYFLGRTEWDRNIVRYYSPGARYFTVQEPMKQDIMTAAGTWEYKDREKLRILTISSADDRKGNEIILRTAHILKHIVRADFEWDIAGDADCFSGAESRTGICHEEVNITLMGRISTPQMTEELARADLFVHPSIIDNSPNAVCEAQVVGCPVIVSNVGCVPQLVEDGVTGFLYPYNEPHTLAFLIANLKGDEELLCRISEQETAAAAARHDPEGIAKALFGVFQEIIAERDGERNA